MSPSVLARESTNPLLLSSHGIALPGSDDRLICQLPDAKPAAAMLPHPADKVDAPNLSCHQTVVIGIGFGCHYYSCVDSNLCPGDLIIEFFSCY